jgi:hypothetical protein
MGPTGISSQSEVKADRNEQDPLTSDGSSIGKVYANSFKPSRVYYEVDIRLGGDH